MKITYIILLLSFVGCGSNVVQFKNPDDSPSISNETPAECSVEQQKALESCSSPTVDVTYLCHLKQIECVGQCAKVCYNNTLNPVDCVCQDYSECYAGCWASCSFDCK